MAICVTRAAARLSCVAVIQMLLSHTALSASSPSQDTSGVPSTMPPDNPREPLKGKMTDAQPRMTVGYQHPAPPAAVTVTTDLADAAQGADSRPSRSYPSGARSAGAQPRDASAHPHQAPHFYLATPLRQSLSPWR